MFVLNAFCSIYLIAAINTSLHLSKTLKLRFTKHKRVYMYVNVRACLCVCVYVCINQMFDVKSDV